MTKLLKSYFLPLLLSFSFLMASLIASPAYAILNLKLTQGVRSAVPIAIVPFENVASLPEALQVSAVVAHDLSNSGEFSVLTSQLPQDPHAVANIDVSKWRGFKAQYVVVGSITSVSADQYRVSMSLVNLYHESTDKVSPSSVLLTKVYTVQKNQLRRLAHQISDEINLALLGYPGIFNTKIAYVLVQKGKTPTQPDYHLMVADYDGYNPLSAASSNQPMMSPAWSPDSRKIAFVSFSKTLPAIFVTDVQTGQIQQITKLAGINGAPAWSPDGKKIAFVSSETGYAKLYEIDLSTQQTRRLTDGYSIDTEPCYMPNGNALVFTSSRGGNPQIYQYTFANKAIERLTYSGDYNASASISQDGKQMAVLHKDDRGFNIGLQQLETDQFKVLTKDSEDESPQFSPNGKLILYATHTGGQHVLAIVSTDGQIHLTLPASDGNVQEPSWAKLSF